VGADARASMAGTAARPHYLIALIAAGWIGRRSSGGGTIHVAG